MRPTTEPSPRPDDAPQLPRLGRGRPRGPTGIRTVEAPEDYLTMREMCQVANCSYEVLRLRIRDRRVPIRRLLGLIIIGEEWLPVLALGEREWRAGQIAS